MLLFWPWIKFERCSSCLYPGQAWQAVCRQSSRNVRILHLIKVVPLRRGMPPEYALATAVTIRRTNSRGHRQCMLNQIAPPDK